MVSLRSKPSVLAERDVHQSELLPQLFLAYGHDHLPSNILDVGVGGSYTIDAFAFYRSRLHFLDLFSLALPEHGSDSRQQAYAHHAFRDLLSDCQGVAFDLCLFWDLPLLLTRPALRGLSIALAPNLTEQSQGYVVGQRFADREGQAWRYRIQDAQHLIRLPAEPESGTPCATSASWSLQQFSEDFDCFQLAADRLTPDGRLELLFGMGG